MKLQLGEILQNRDAIEALSKLSLPGLKAFEVMEFVEDVDKNLDRYNKIRQETIKRLGSEKKDEEGNPTGEMFIDPQDTESFQSFLREMNDLLVKEVNLPDLELTKDQFNLGAVNAQTDNLKAKDLLYIKARFVKKEEIEPVESIEDSQE